jgi:hypothetical protein
MARQASLDRNAIRRRTLGRWVLLMGLLDAPPADVNACRPSQIFFAEHVWPEFLGQTYSGMTCGDARCHDPASGRPFRSEAPTSVPTYPFAAQSDWEKLYLSATQQLICTNVRGSELYTRPAGLRTHGGGKLIEPDGPEALLLDMWVGASP